MQGLQTLEVGLSLISQESIALGDTAGGSKVAMEYRWAYVERGNQRQVTASGPECVKTLSYRACFSPLLLSTAISRLFTAISAGNASERV